MNNTFPVTAGNSLPLLQRVIVVTVEEGSTLRT